MDIDKTVGARHVLTAHQPVYLPWLGLFHKIASAPTFVSFDGVQYLPKDWNNRNRIKTPNGAEWLTVPVLRHGHRDKPIVEIEINNVVPWRRKHWRALELSYRKAPYFDEYAAALEAVYEREWRYLTELDEHLLLWFLEMLGIEVRFLKASELGLEGRKSDLVLDMCKRLGADVYIFGALGRDYAKVEEFAAAGVRVVFQDYRHPVYPQLHGAFEPYLSVVDLLFNCGPASLDVLMSGQEAVVA
jgi:hypothetical protein